MIQYYSSVFSVKETKKALLCKVMESLEIHVVGAAWSSILFFSLKNEYINVATIRKRNEVRKCSVGLLYLATSLSALNEMFYGQE